MEQRRDALLCDGGLCPSEGYTPITGYYGLDALAFASFLLLCLMALVINLRLEAISGEVVKEDGSGDSDGGKVE